jgi:hypothetical protein
MQNIIPAEQNGLLKTSHLAPYQVKMLKGSVFEFFRENVLGFLPVEDYANLFCGDNGRPTKELTSVLGAIVLQHLFNLNDVDLCRRFAMDNDFIYALKLDCLPDKDRRICPRTLWAHSKRLANSDLLDNMLQKVSAKMAVFAGVDLSCQRLDSVHVRSNMAKLTRIELFFKTVKLFLKALKKSHRDLFDQLDKGMRDRYLSEDRRNEKSSYNFFGRTTPGERQKNLTDMAGDIFQLINMFKENEAVSGMSSFGLLSRLFSEQCEVEPAGGDEDGDSQKVTVIDPKKIPASCLQNPSDPDATYGYKGQGYSLQVMETCSDERKDGDEKEINLITHISLTGASVHDGAALIPAIEDTERNGMKPEKVLCDTAYGSDSNVEEARKNRVEVISPAGGSDPEAGKIRLADFAFDDDGMVESCPEGQKPWNSERTGNDNAVCGFDPQVCGCCPRQAACPVKMMKNRAELKYSAKDVRLSARRRFEETKAFKKMYRMRSGIEATNSMLDRVTGLKHLRYRGRKNILLPLTCKAIGINIRRIAPRLRKK